MTLAILLLVSSPPSHQIGSFCYQGPVLPSPPLETSTGWHGARVLKEQLTEEEEKMEISGQLPF